MKEVWKQIPNTNGMIEVSNLGRCRSWNNNGFGRRSEPEFRPKKLPKSGYIRIWDGEKNQLLHRVIAELFIPNPHDKPEVNHKDGNKQNNCVENLEWCTSEENKVHASKNDLLYKKYSVSRQDVLQIRLLHDYTDLSSSDIGDLFGLSRYTAYDIGAKRCLKHIN